MDTGLEMIFYMILNMTLLILLSPFFMTFIKKIKAYIQLRHGPPFFQGYWSILKLMKKERVYSRNSSLIMRITPLINISILLVASICVPLVFVPKPLWNLGNIILFLYLLALAKFFMALGGLDAGSSFGGMGSSREMTISAIIEPTTVITLGALAITQKSLDFHRIFFNIAKPGGYQFNPLILPLAVALFLILIVETGRIPIDNPETHLELTMIHEGMILEQSGSNLALMELSHAFKQMILMAILINIFLPWGLTTEFTLFSILVGVIAFFFKCVIISILVGIYESSVGKLRYFRVPGILSVAFVLSLVTVLMVVIS